MNYLISCESNRLIFEEIKKIVKDNNYLVFNMLRSSIKEVIEEASYICLGFDKRVLVVTNASIFTNSKVSDEDSELLTKYLMNPNRNTTIIFTTEEKIDLRKKNVKIIKEQGNLINIEKLDKRGINNLLTNYLRSNEYNIDYKTINYIMDNSFNNIDIMFNELDKIMLYYDFPCTIKYMDVISIVGEEKSNNNFLFVASVVEKNLNKAVKILNNLKIYKVEVTVLVSLLAREYRLMYYVKNMYNKKSVQEVMKYLNLQEWQVNKLYNNSIKYTNKELLDNLVSLCNIDINIKRGIWDKDTAIYKFLMEACS